MKIFKVIFEDNGGVYRVYIPAKTIKQLKEEYGGNGDIISITDVTNQYPICIETLIKSLKVMGYGQVEIDIISRTLQHTLDNII